MTPRSRAWYPTRKGWGTRSFAAGPGHQGRGQRVRRNWYFCHPAAAQSSSSVCSQNPTKPSQSARSKRSILNALPILLARILPALIQSMRVYHQPNQPPARHFPARGTYSLEASCPMSTTTTMGSTPISQRRISSPGRRSGRVRGMLRGYERGMRSGHGSESAIKERPALRWQPVRAAPEASWRSKPESCPVSHFIVIGRNTFLYIPVFLE